MVERASASLTRQLLAAHHAGASPYGALRVEDRAAGSPIALRVDHVACGDAEATLALLSLECLTRSRTGPLGFVALEGDGMRGGFELGEEQKFVDATSRAAGWNVSRSGNGCAWGVYEARLAAPGRMVAGPVAWVRRVGAYGMLGIPADPIELAVTLAGVPLVRPIPNVLRVRLVGRVGPGVGGTDLAWMLVPLLRARTVPGVVELMGEGMTALPIEERIACARALDRATGWAALFPSDAVTRGALHAFGRESDWRAIPVDEAVDVDLDLDVSNFDALAWDPLARAHVPARSVNAVIRRIVMGPECEFDELQLVARTLEVHGLAPGIELWMVVGTRALHAELAAGGWIERLRALGVVIVDPGPEAHMHAERDPETTLVCGLGGPELVDAWQGSAAVCATTAVRGRLGDPREHALPPVAREPRAPLSTSDEVPVPRPWIPVAGAMPAPIMRDGLVPPRMLTPITDSVRGEILLRVPDDGSTVLAWGARLHPIAHRLERLAAQVLVRVDPQFAARTAARGGGFVLWQGAYRSGGHPLAAALALARLGIRVVLARTFEAEDREALAAQGVLPLSSGAGPGLERLAAGDEVELPDLPEGLEPRRPVVLRDLTRGQQLLLRHDLDTAAVAFVRAGGRLAAAAAVLAESA
jgi:aconitate hydratase